MYLVITMDGTALVFYVWFYWLWRIGRHTEAALDMMLMLSVSVALMIGWTQQTGDTAAGWRFVTDCV